jgi:FMN phosphatase YigB (HAD superfamily)
MMDKFKSMSVFASKPRAIICDIYGTLITMDDVGAESESRWQAWGRTHGAGELPSLTALRAETDRQTAQHHALARDGGIRYPEVDWIAILAAALRALGCQLATIDGDTAVAHARCLRSARALPGAREALRAWQGRISLGILSNAQDYTLAELAEAGIDRRMFDPAICLWSYREGIAKPEKALFAKITHTLAARGILPHEILMVGDRADNDLAPATACGWMTWHLSDTPTSSWPALLAAIDANAE